MINENAVPQDRPWNTIVAIPGASGAPYARRLLHCLASPNIQIHVVASNAGGSVTSLVATLMVLTTNQSLLVGAPAGDVITKFSADPAPTSESVEHAIDRVAQKWLSFGLLNNVLPYVGPVGYTVTPVSGSRCQCKAFGNP